MAMGTLAGDGIGELARVAAFTVTSKGGLIDDIFR